MDPPLTCHERQRERIGDRGEHQRAKRRSNRVGPEQRFQNCDQAVRSEEHTSELQSLRHLVCRLLLEKKKKEQNTYQKTKTSQLHNKEARISKRRKYEMKMRHTTNLQKQCLLHNNNIHSDDSMPQQQW